jgi:pimeloyl-ACP methyl ester carboxylesterase
MVTIEGAGVELACEVVGQGPPVVLVHDMASDSIAMAPVAGALSGSARVITYDRRGYGASGAPEPYERTTVNEQAEDAARVIAAIDGGAPAIVVGDGFGALVALDLLLRHGAAVRGAVLSDPPLFAFVAQATEELGAQRELLAEHLRTDGPEAAVAAWLGGRAGEAAVARARGAHRAFFADFGGLASWPVTRRELRSIEQPTVVLTGSSSRASIELAADTVAELLPAAQRRRDGDLEAAARALLA